MVRLRGQRNQDENCWLMEAASFAERFCLRDISISEFFKALIVRLLNVLTGNAVIPGLIFSDRLRQQIVDRPETLLPVNGNVVPGQRVVLLFGHQTMSAIQHRFHFAQCGFQPVNARLDVSERFFSPIIRRISPNALSIS